VQAHGGSPRSAVSLVESDPDLASRLEPAAREEARRFAVAARLKLLPGAWDPTGVLETEGALGVLVLDGLLIRDVLLANTRCTELIGAGDVVDPRDLGATERLVPVEIDWTVVDEAHVAVLDARFTALAGRWPDLVSALFDRASERSFRLATAVAICQLGRVEMRLLAMMWHLSERWGRVSGTGMALPLRLSHATLGRLIGAQRPTITLALKELTSRGEVVRREAGGWLLPGGPPPELSRAVSTKSERRTVRVLPSPAIVPPLA
jgi:CRP/FNR family transcriptional regulator, cyclic AMP receptor protein